MQEENGKKVTNFLIGQCDERRNKKIGLVYHQAFIIWDAIEFFLNLTRRFCAASHFFFSFDFCRMGPYYRDIFIVMYIRHHYSHDL
jgi:hypothetical protein